METAKIKIKDGVLLNYLSDEEEVVIPEGVIKIGTRAFCSLFKKCKNLKKVIIPSNIAVIYQDAFRGCQIIDIDVNENNSNYASIDGVLFDKTKKELIFYPSGKCKQQFVVPNGVTRIYSHAFHGSKLEKITLPVSIEKLDFESLCCLTVYFEGNRGQWEMIEKNWSVRGCDVFFNDGSEPAHYS